MSSNSNNTGNPSACPVAPSERLEFRRITADDFGLVASTLQNAEVARIWTHEFSDGDVRAWIERRLAEYREPADGSTGYLLALRREDGAAVGQVGLLSEEILGRRLLCVGYVLAEPFRGMGYATEGARAMLDHAFRVLGAQSVCADIRPENLPSLAVADRLGMTRGESFVKHYRGRDLVHILCEITREEYFEKFPANM